MLDWPEILKLAVVFGAGAVSALFSYAVSSVARTTNIPWQQLRTGVFGTALVGIIVFGAIALWQFNKYAPHDGTLTQQAAQQELDRALEQAAQAQQQIQEETAAPTETTQSASTQEASATAKPTHAVVQVYFATDRNLIAESPSSAIFGIDRANLSYGICYVSIPLYHRLGELEGPSVWRWEFREDPEKHVVLLGTLILDGDAFFSEMSQEVRKSDQNSAFLFVHGYNVTFEDAARRTAQISYDLGFDGAAVFYSWPSQGSKIAYTVDEQNIEWAEANLRAFLEDFFVRSDAERIFLIAHSMGNRALTRVVASLLEKHPDFRKRLSEVILTAPDIDADVFKRDIAPALVAMGRPVTLYSSSEDLALVASKKVHGYPRAGDSGLGLLLVPGIETIDATNVDTNLLGHSYFAQTPSVLSDIYYLVRSNQRADQRFGLRGIDVEGGRYWEFKP